jgi:hypothetical protein
LPYGVACAVDVVSVPAGGSPDHVNTGLDALKAFWTKASAGEGLGLRFSAGQPVYHQCTNVDKQ